MTRHLTPWALGSGLAAFILLAHALTNNLPDADPPADWEGAVQAQQDARAHQAAADLCEQAVGGPPVWAADGSLLCQRPNSRATVWVASAPRNTTPNGGRP